MKMEEDEPELGELGTYCKEGYLWHMRDRLPEEIRRFIEEATLLTHEEAWSLVNPRGKEDHYRSGPSVVIEALDPARTLYKILLIFGEWTKGPGDQKGVLTAFFLYKGNLIEVRDYPYEIRTGLYGLKARLYVRQSQWEHREEECFVSVLEEFASGLKRFVETPIPYPWDGYGPEGIPV